MIFNRRWIFVASAMVVSALSAPFAAAAPIAFPGAEGFGASATGGRGGSIVHVANLNDAGPGSLRDALSQPRRIIVFDVAGIIHLNSPLIFSSDITLAGQTAPGGGITVFGHGVSCSDKHNIIVRYVRFRSSIASSRGSKTLNLGSGSNIIIDHVSVSWGRWDNFGITGGGHDITLQDSIIAEAIDPQRFGALIDSSTNITVARTLWIDNQSRNPKGKANIQVINDVVYNYGSGGYCGGHSGAVWNQDLIGNYFIAGPNSSEHFLTQFTSTDHVFQTGNLADVGKDGKLNGREVAVTDFHANSPGEAPTFVKEPFNHPIVPVTVLSAADAYARILDSAGASLHRDQSDQRVIEQLRSLGATGAIIHDESAVGGIGAVASEPPPVDSDGDGIPDSWETAHGLDPHNPTDAPKTDDATGYANIELYINSIAPPSRP
jgi:hypothetical protein